MKRHNYPPEIIITIYEVSPIIAFSALERNIYIYEQKKKKTRISLTQEPTKFPPSTDEKKNCVC